MAETMQNLMQNEFMQTLLLVLFALAVVFLLVQLALRVTRRYVLEPTRLYQTSRTIRRIGLFAAILAVIGLFSPGAGDILTLLTVIGAGLAIAMREVVLSVAGWMRITVMSTYKHGDRIEIGGVQGDVIDIRVLRTTLMEIGGWVDADQSTGRIVHVPNNWVFEHGLYNYTRGFKFIWHELALTISFRSDWQAARKIMQELAEESASIVAQQVEQEIRDMSREYLVHYSILTPFVYVRIVENGVQLTLRYLCEARKRRGTEHALTVCILDAFRKQGHVELAYPMLGISTAETPQFGPFPDRAERGS